ncbi:MAG: hypothetical protein M5U34_28935 [Chloroflexi bacterium]|nr:hypothetical protein [Chloroflexota bacterium]
MPICATTLQKTSLPGHHHIHVAFHDNSLPRFSDGTPGPIQAKQNFAFIK